MGAEIAYEFSSRCHLDRVVEAPETAEESVTEYSYDCGGNLERVWDGNHPSSGGTATPTQTYAYDELNRLESVAAPWAPGGVGATAITSFGYDVQDHLTDVTDANGNHTSYQYSDRDLLTAESSPVTGTTTHTYNAHGERQSTTDGRGLLTQRTVDAADRTELVIYPSPALNVDYAYGNDPLSFERGRLVSVTRGPSTVSYGYDSFGRLAQDGALAYSYDPNGNRNGIAFPDGLVLTYTHDFADREQSLIAQVPGGSPQVIVSGAAWAPGGPLTGLTLGNGLSEARAFDRRYAPASIGVPGALAWAYTVDGVGNPTAIDDLQPTDDDRAFEYQDVQYFLTSADGPWGTRDFTYDKIGSRLTHTRNGVTDTYSYVGPTPKLAQVAVGGGGGARSYTHDAGGFLTEVASGANAMRLSWDAEGRLSSVVRPAGGEGAALGFLYDGRGFLHGSGPAGLPFGDDLELGRANCWTEAAPGAANACSYPTGPAGPLYDSRGLLHAVDGTAHVLYFAGRPVAQANVTDVAPAWTYLTTDHLGTPVLATTQAGAVQWSGGFEPFGEDWQDGTANDALASGIFLRLPGQWESAGWEPATMGVPLYQNVHRWYEVGTGRYASADPLGLAGLGQTFAYAGGNPTKLIDPLGLFQVDGSCDCTQPAPVLESIPRELARARQYWNRPQCQQELVKHADVQRCMRGRFSAEEVGSGPLIRCSANRPNRPPHLDECGETAMGLDPDYPDGVITLFPGKGGCPRSNPQLGLGQTIFHEALHTCGLADHGAEFTAIMLSCTGEL